MAKPEKGSTTAPAVRKVRLQLDIAPHTGTVEHPGGQVLMIAAALRYKITVWMCGRRVGKTVADVLLGLEEQAKKVGNYHLGLVAPDHAKAKELQHFVVSALGGDPRFNPASIVRNVRHDEGQDRWVELPGLSDVNTGGRWYFWSGQHPYYRAIQGFVFPFDRLIVNEMQLQQPALVTEVLFPMSLDSGGGITLEGHPKRGMPGNHLFTTYYQRGLSKDEEWKDYFSVRMPSEANPLMSKEEIAKGRAGCITKEEEQEEYDAIPVDDAGGVFPNVNQILTIPPMHRDSWPEWLNALVVQHPLPGGSVWMASRPRPRTKYGIGVDWGRWHDATIFTVFDLVTNQQVLLVRIRNEEFEDQLRWLHTIRTRYNNALVHGDENGLGEAMGERLRRAYKAGYKGHKFSAVNKELYVRRGQIHFKERLVRLINCPEQSMEFRNFSIIPPKNDDEMGGRNTALRYGHPPNEHDDFVDAFLVLTESFALGQMARRHRAPEPEGYTMGWFMRQDAERRQAHAAASRRFGPILRPR